MPLSHIARLSRHRDSDFRRTIQSRQALSDDRTTALGWCNPRRQLRRRGFRLSRPSRSESPRTLRTSDERRNRRHRSPHLGTPGSSWTRQRLSLFGLPAPL